DGVEQDVAAAGVRVDRVGPADGDDAADGGHERADDEARDADPVDRDTGAAGRLGIAADRVDVPAVRGPAQHERPDDQEERDDRDDDRDTLDRDDRRVDGPFLGQDRGRHQNKHGEAADSQEHDAERVGHQTARSAAADPVELDERVADHHDDRQDPAPKDGHVAVGQLQDEGVPDGDVDAAAEQDEQDALEGEERGQRDDERRNADLAPPDRKSQLLN